MGEEAGGTAVGELLEGEVDLLFQRGEGSGIAGELFGPGFLLLGQSGLEIRKGLISGCRHLDAGFVAEAEQHGNLLTQLHPPPILRIGRFPASLSGNAPDEGEKGPRITLL